MVSDFLIEAELLHPFILGLDKTIYDIFKSKCRRTSLKISYENSSYGDVSTSLVITGDIFGFVSLSFTNEYVLNCASNLIGECDEVDDDVIDSMASVINTVAGVAQTLYEEQNVYISHGLPLIVEGAVKCPKVYRKIPVVSCLYESEQCHLELSLRLDKSH
ncbi:MAG: chemotaxis protein CheX [Lentisphaeria bacterium]|nr:chemotaxis protein CheX [Lentisphaeria bacterium]NQZ67321.1 chemotaxis protein CheX [Lentisphaeria bacterium]